MRDRMEGVLRVNNVSRWSTELDEVSDDIPVKWMSRLLSSLMQAQGTAISLALSDQY